jgi:hypothetical protein
VVDVAAPSNDRPRGRHRRAGQARGQVPEYRSPADVERIAELERLLADRA